MIQSAAMRRNSASELQLRIRARDQAWNTQLLTTAYEDNEIGIRIYSNATDLIRQGFYYKSSSWLRAKLWIFPDDLMLIRARTGHYSIHFHSTERLGIIELDKSKSCLVIRTNPSQMSCGFDQLLILETPSGLI